MSFERIAKEWVRLAYRARAVVLLLALIGSVGAGLFVVDNLGINTDTADMISPLLPWRQQYIEFQEQFPHVSDTLVVVLDARTPDRADQAADRLSASLSRLPETFDSVEWIEGHEFFRRNALLFMDAKPRRALMDQLITAQPLLGRLHRDPGLAAVTQLLDDAVAATGPGGEGSPVAPALVDRFIDEYARAIEASVEGRFHRLSWRGLFAGDAVPEKGTATRTLLVVRPVLDFNQAFPAAHAQAVIRDQAMSLGLTPERGVRLRITGGVAMSEEELRSVSRGAFRTGVLALLAVALVLAVGLGSLRMVVVTVLTLVAGLIWTAAFAAFAVGHLNMISVAFAVLYIGLGVDYAVHYGLRYRELRFEGCDHEASLLQAARDVGGALALCALTTGTGFFAFLPTDFAGVSELGLIAGVGMFISLAATLTLMPALLSVIPVEPRGVGVAFKLGAGLDQLGQRHGRAVLVGSTIVALVCIAAAFNARFDDNPLNLRDAEGEAVSTYRQLVAEGDTWSLNLLARDSEATRHLTSQFKALHEVKGVVSLLSFVPADQDVALADLDELALLLGPDLSGTPGDPTPVDAARPVLGELKATLTGLSSRTEAQHRLVRSLDVLERAMRESQDSGEALLADVAQSVVGTLPGEIARLGQALDGDRILPDELPAALYRNWRSADGRIRVRVDAREDLNRREALVGFVSAVRDVSPGAVGTPIVHLESATVVVGAFVQAFALALVSIVVILFLVLRSAGQVVMALVPLLLAALVTVGVLVVLQVPFNFANVIALPLLLGIGVDSGIHMLTRARMADSRSVLAASGTARGVVTSAVTTAASFGNLAFSVHPGTASMGIVLSVGMVCILVTTLLVMPALAPVCLGRDPGVVRP